MGPVQGGCVPGAGFAYTESGLSVIFREGLGFLYTLGLDNRDLFLRAANRSLFIALRRNRNMSQKRPAAGVEGAVTER